jgi:hypothetical protein
MAKKAETKSRDGNTAQLEALETEIDRLKDVQEKILVQKRDAEKLLGEKNAENAKLKESLKVAYEKIKNIESMEAVAETMTRGYVELATMPFNGLIPPPSSVGGVLVPRRIDEDGIVFEQLPVANAIRLITDGSAFRRYLTGPEGVYKIEGEASVGVFKKPVVFHKHRKTVLSNGEVEFIRVEIEESGQKAE